MRETGKPSPEDMGELDPFKEMRESEYWNKIPPGFCYRVDTSDD